jgi:hypothetical protein
MGGVASVLVFQHGWPAPRGDGLVFVLGVAIGLGMGALIVGQRVPSFIITLGGLLVFKGLHWLVIQSATVPIALGGKSNPLLAFDDLLPAPRDWHFARLHHRGSLGLGADRIAPPEGGVGAAARGPRDRDDETPRGDQGLLLFVLVTNRYRG